METTTGKWVSKQIICLPGHAKAQRPKAPVPLRPTTTALNSFNFSFGSLCVLQSVGARGRRRGRGREQGPHKPGCTYDKYA